MCTPKYYYHLNYKRAKVKDFFLTHAQGKHAVLFFCFMDLQDVCKPNKTGSHNYDKGKPFSMLLASASFVDR